MEDPYKVLERVTGFEWDQGNLLKNWEKHQVSASECEEAFFNRPLLVSSDEKHSQEEPRYFALARTNSTRELFIVFTVRGSNIRVISARDMNQREREAYWRNP